MIRIVAMTLLLTAGAQLARGDSREMSLFHSGQEAYRGGDYAAAAMLFHDSALKTPASGTLQNLGLAEWQRGQTGLAVLAWEQALWLNPFNSAARENLRFVRKVAQLETPELAWFEVVSTWLPVNWWAWLACLSFWTAVAAGSLPGLLGGQKAVWQQAIAAAGLAVFLLSVPAHLGVRTRAHLGYIVQKDCSLRLTPTSRAQVLTRLPAGEGARLLRRKAGFLLVRTSHGQGWVQKQEFGLISPSA